MVTTTRRPNVETPARWAAALTRANEKGLHLYQHDATGQWFCTSSRGQMIYAVSHYQCECQAALANDPVCQHRALFRQACRVEDERVEAMLTAADEGGLGMTEAELDALIASATLPYDPDAVAAMLDALPDDEDERVLTFDEAAALRTAAMQGEGATVLSVPATGGPITDHPARCRECKGSGWTRMYTGDRLSDWRSVPCGCQRQRHAA